MSTCWPFRSLEQLFRHKVLKLLLLEGRITAATATLMAKRRPLAMNRIFENPDVFIWISQVIERKKTL
jgi:hypothetical protein